MLKAGFIGAGGRSQGAHYPSVNRREDDVEMLGACELDEEKLAQVSQKYEFPNTFTDHRKMLDTLDLYVVYCVMNEKWILQPALDCLNAGKHLYSALSEIATSVGAISRSRPLYEGTPIPDLLVLRKSY